MRRIATAGALIIAAALTLTGNLGVQAASASTCTQWALGKEADGTQVVVNADNWNGGNACLNVDGGADFSVASQSMPYNPDTLAYPNVSIGCSGGYCSTSSGLPVPEPAAAPVVTWSTVNSSPGSKFDTTLDLMFSSTPNTAPPIGAEVMVMINSSGYTAIGLPGPGSPIVMIDGALWYYQYRTTGRWPRTQFTAVSTGDSVTNLALAPFFAYANGLGALPTSLSLVQVLAGNELWQGGTGLGTTSFSVSGV
jgi:cellulose 1,4-beta-cellobiosidase